MVIRDLTLRSAASFGSFHLIRLLYDEYMFYLIEHKVAACSGKTPIAIMTEVLKNIGFVIYSHLILLYQFSQMASTSMESIRAGMSASPTGTYMYMYACTTQFNISLHSHQLYWLHVYIFKYISN